MTGSLLLGQRIKEMREERGYSQSVLAEKAMIAQSTLSYIEAGKKSPTYETLRSISIGLGVSVLEILKYDQEEGSNQSIESFNKKLRSSLSEDELKQLVDQSAFVYKKISSKKR